MTVKLLVAFATLAPAALWSQPASDTVARLDSMMRTYIALARANPNAIWPGFRPETIPVALVLDGGTLLFNWRGELPEGFTPVSGAADPRAGGPGWRSNREAGAASTSTRIGDRGVAQVRVRELNAADVISTSFHEAFHVFQNSRRRAGQRFGAGENTMLLATYPIFDARNEAFFAMETAILASATDARATDAKREHARQFVAVRRLRHRQLPDEFALFDRASEMNEGLAEYALVRGLELLASAPDAPRRWRDTARAQLGARSTQLRGVVRDSSASTRLRYYHTGPAIARLLDVIEPRWKQRFVEDNLWLEDALAVASGLEDAQRAALGRAVAAFDSAAHSAQAVAGIAALQSSRRALVERALAEPGVLLVVHADSLPTRNFNLCGFDPQNMLAITATVAMQRRWWRPCSGGPTYVEITGTSVHDTDARTLSAVIGADSAITLTAGGASVPLPRDGETLRDLRGVKLAAPQASVEAARADVTRTGRVLAVWPKRP